MVRYYTHYWQNATWKHMVKIKKEVKDYKLARAGSNMFRNRNVKVGDYVYVVTVINGELYLGGRICVEKILDQKQVEEYHDWGYEIWTSDDHIVSSLDKAMDFIPDRRIPADSVKNIKFHTRSGPKPLKFVNEMIDRQTLRGVRRLTEESTKLLDLFLD